MKGVGFKKRLSGRGVNKNMPSEAILRANAKDYFTQLFPKEVVKVWFPSRVKYKAEIDIFSIWDGICWVKDKFIFFQLTTISNKSARLKKIINVMLPNHLYFTKPCEGILMCWRKKEKRFEVFKI